MPPNEDSCPALNVTPPPAVWLPRITMNPVPVGAHGKVKSVLDIGKYSKVALDATEIAVGVYLAAVVAGVTINLPLFTVQGPEMPLLDPLTYRYMFATERRVLPA